MQFPICIYNNICVLGATIFKIFYYYITIFIL